MDSNVQVKVDQLAATAPLSNGGRDYPTMSKMGQLFTAGWQARLAMAGRVFSLNLGAAEAHLAGNHDITTDEPEFLIAADSGWLIPMAIHILAYSDCDASLDSTEILVVADRTQAEAPNATATEETPTNCLDGGDSFGGRCYSVVTGSLTAVTEADIIYSKKRQVVITTDGSFDAAVNANYEWDVPRLIKGPCQIVGYIVGVGTTQVSAFIGSFVFAHLPVSWVTSS